MKQRKILLLTVLALVLLLAGAYVLYGTLGRNVQADQLATKPSSAQATESESVPAPDFTVYDGQGNPVKLSDFTGKPVVLNFWASWCGPCQSEMPDFQETFAELGEQVQFLMVNATGGRETLESGKAFIENAGYTFPVFYDTQEDASRSYGVSALPTTFFIDAQGNIVTWARGAINKQLLLKGIGMITQ